MSDEDDIDFFASSTSYLESLIKGRHGLKDSKLLSKLDELILLEINLAIMGAEKAKSELLKSSKNNIKPIK